MLEIGNAVFQHQSVVFQPVKLLIFSNQCNSFSVLNCAVRRALKWHSFHV